MRIEGARILTRLWVKQPQGRWLVFMTLVTAVYLIVECAFNSRLLDVVGGMPEHEAVESVERFGRLISGFAVALMLWPGFFIRRHRHGANQAMMVLKLALCSAAVILLVYHSEKRLVDTLVDHSTPDSRYLATNLGMVQHALLLHSATLDGLPLERSQMNAPDGKAFLAIFPMLAVTTRDLDKKLHDNKAGMVRGILDHDYGGLAASYNRFITTRRTWIELYRQHYLPASHDWQRRIEHSAEYGAEQLQDLRARHLYPAHTPHRQATLVQFLAKQGVVVNTRALNETALLAAFAQQQRTLADQTFATAIRAIPVASPLPPGLGRDGFFSHPGVQQRWQAQAGLELGDDILPVALPTPAEAPAFFARDVYGPLLNRHVATWLMIFDAPPATFADGQPLAKLGKDSMRALLVPPIALAFSVTGALVHVFKLLFFTLQLIYRRGFGHPVYKAVAIVSLAMTLLATFTVLPSTTITREPLYRYFEQQGALLGGSGQPTLAGDITVFFARSTLHAQPLVYPVFESLRLTLLAGYEFGYHPGTRARALPDISSAESAMQHPDG